MGLKPEYMWLAFLVTVVGLWLLGLLATIFLGRKSLVVFIGGDDDRLSLSKAQAFAWTLIIVSSFVAAMSVHTLFKPEQSWIAIPNSLLALAGIVIGSGVFSSVISAIKEEKRTAEVTGLAYDVKTGILTITGVAFGTNRGAVRIVGFDKKRWDLSVSHWDDGTILLIIEQKVEKRLFAFAKTVAISKTNTLIVDTQNGKASYRFDFDGTIATLRRPVIYYEFVDFFRDDQNPSILSIMKYQMFVWTLIAIVIYTFVFLKNPSNSISTLPELGEKFVILMGLSQAGYLGGKAAPKTP
jgi:hypothetical protein